MYMYIMDCLGLRHCDLSRVWRKCTTQRRRALGLVLTFLLLCFLLYEQHGGSNTNFTVSQLKKDLIRPPFVVEGDEKHDIILSAYMNSGSRFTGKLLGFINQSFYFYEPLWKFTVWDYYRPPNIRCSSTEGSCRSVQTKTENTFQPDQFDTSTETIVPDLPSNTQPVELMLHVISCIFRCDLVRLKNVIQERVHDHFGYSGPSWEMYRRCLLRFYPKTSCLRDLENVCKSKSHRVLKTLRLSVSAFRPLMEVNPRLKIVHLVRDPRAIINSRLYSRFYPIANPRTNNSLEQNLCEKMRTDINEAIQLREDFPGRVIILYYEDLMDNLHVRLKQVYENLGLTFNSEEVNTFSDIKVNLSPPEKGNNFTKDRKRSNAMWWRKYMTNDHIQSIDYLCYDVYNILGYRALSEQRVRDMKVSSYEVPDYFKL